MKAIENLRDYLDNLDHYQPTPASIDALGTDLVRAASAPEGYKDLVWEAGAWLLMYAEDHLKNNATDFLQAFGYRAIANALRTSLENGDFPLALGFFVHDFVSAGQLKALATNTIIQQALKNIPEEKLIFNFSTLQAVDSKCRKKYLEFLQYAGDFGFPLSSLLQMAAALLAVANEDEKPAATHIFLDMLEASGKKVSLFFCWRAASETILLENEKTYVGSLVSVLKASQQLGENALSVVANLLDDQELPSLIGDDPCLLILLGLVGWWISVRHERNQYTNIARTFCYSLIKITPDLAHTLLEQIDKVSNSLPADIDTDTETEEQQRAIQIENLQRDFQQEMQVLHGELRIRTYRGVPLALKMYRHNVVHIFDPLYAALEDSSALTEEQISTIENLDAEDLIDNNPLQRENVHTRKEIIGELRANMIRDQQTIIQSFQRALTLRKRLTLSAEYDPIATLARAPIKREVKQLLLTHPDILWAFQWLLPEVLETH